MATQIRQYIQPVRQVRVSTLSTEVNNLLQLDTMILLLDDQEKPVTVLLTEDIHLLSELPDWPIDQLLGKLPPGIVVGSKATFEGLAASPIAIMLDAGVRGLAVYDKNELMGALPANLLVDFIVNDFIPEATTKGLETAFRLDGDIVTNPIIMYCTDYHHRNELDYYDPSDPPECQEMSPRPHPIKH